VSLNSSTEKVEMILNYECGRETNALVYFKAVSDSSPQGLRWNYDVHHIGYPSQSYDPGTGGIREDPSWR